MGCDLRVGLVKGDAEKQEKMEEEREQRHKQRRHANGRLAGFQTGKF